MGTLKSGWLEKLGGFFTKDWKRRYFVLYSDGQLCYYKDAIDREPHGKIHLKSECRRVNIGYQVDDGVKVPSHRSIDCLFSIGTTEKSWYLLAESEQECRAWAAVIDQARTPISYGGHGYGEQLTMPMPQPGFSPHVMPSAPPMAAAAYPTASYPPPTASYQPPPAAYGQAQFPQQSYPNPQPYPPQAYPQQGYPPQTYLQAGYPPQPPSTYAYQPPPHGHQTTYAPQGYQQPVQYVQTGQSQSSSRNKNLLMGAAGGALLGYGVGSMFHGLGHFGGSFSDDDWGGGWSS